MIYQRNQLNEVLQISPKKMSLYFQQILCMELELVFFHLKR